MIVRDFQRNDLLEVDALLYDHNEDSIKVPWQKHDTGYFGDTLEQLTRSARGLAIVAEDEKEVVGALVAAATPNLFLPRLQASALWWKVKYPGRGIGGALMNSFYLWAEELGAGILTASSFTPEVDDYFTRHGFVKAERTFFKII